jgi:hypothetical protein
MKKIAQYALEHECSKEEMEELITQLNKLKKELHLQCEVHKKGCVLYGYSTNVNCT